MVQYFPTLSMVGWTTNTAEQLDYALAHFFECEYSQSYLYSDKIADVHAIIADNVENIPNMVSALAGRLELYLSSIFDQVSVLGVYPLTDEKDNRVEIKLSIRIKNNDSILDSEKYVNYRFNKFKSITNFSNYGVRL